MPVARPAARVFGAGLPLASPHPPAAITIS